MLISRKTVGPFIVSKGPPMRMVWGSQGPSKSCYKCKPRCIVEEIKEVSRDEEVDSVVTRGGRDYVVHKPQCTVCACVSLPVSEGEVNGTKVKVMRDTGCSSVVVKSDLVRLRQYTGKGKECMLIDGTVRRFPRAFIWVGTDYYVGEVEALVMSTPVFELIIGNISENWGKENGNRNDRDLPADDEGMVSADDIDSKRECHGGKDSLYVNELARC